jgi:hypothetical protein
LTGGYPVGAAMRDSGRLIQRKFKIGQRLFYYRGGRDRCNKAGPYVVLGIMQLANGGIGYRIRSQNDRALEYVAREDELNAS